MPANAYAVGGGCTLAAGCDVRIVAATNKVLEDEQRAGRNPSNPPTPDNPGADPVMGLKLYATFRTAGLPEPELETVRILGGGSDADIYAQGAMVVRSLLPVILAHGIATADEVGIDTLEERLRAESVAGGGVVSMPMHIGARTRLD